MKIKDQHTGKNRGALSAISKTFLEHNLFLKRFLARFLRREQDIEDVVQEVYLKAYIAEKDRKIEQPKAFLFSIAKNLALNELNRKSRQMTGYIEECQTDIPAQTSETLETEIEAAQSLGIYCEAVAALPEKCRRVYLLRKVHGLPHKEIARRLNISLSSVEKHLKKGAESCQRYLANNSRDHTRDILPGKVSSVAVSQEYH